MRGRFESEVTAALRRRLPSEAKLAGALRALSPVSPGLRNVVNEAAQVLVRRHSFDRELYASAVRALAELDDKRAAPLLRTALSSDEAGGLATLSAACFSRDPSLAAPLAKVAASRHAHLAFGAEVARMARGESNGTHLSALAPKIKESHRIALCVELFLPLTRGPTLPKPIAGALAVLRDAERHLGRWLVLAEVASRAQDHAPLLEARRKAANGPQSSRAAWSLVAWALEPEGPVPTTRPTVELVARLSDRPSADRDTTFLFRLAASRAPAARPMLEGLAKANPLNDEVAIRAAMHLARDHGRAEMRKALVEAALGKRDEIRGIAAAALWDLGDRDLARKVADRVESERPLGSMTWGALVTAAAAGKLGSDCVLAEPNFRRVQWGWVE
ncbi:MAG TPA: hypothetical protein VK550_06345 [Polyangiaceae bacterium]|nr:hypothetical protein [Polyangiaceae bacterium]